MAITASQLMNQLKTTKFFGRVLQKVVVTHLGNGSCTAEMKVCEEHTNPIGGLHGGLSATLVDHLSMFALLTDSKVSASVSVDMHMTYLGGAVIGDEIEINAKTLKTGKSLAFLEALITNKSTGQLLIKGNQTVKIFRKAE